MFYQHDLKIVGEKSCLHEYKIQLLLYKVQHVQIYGHSLWSFIYFFSRYTMKKVNEIRKWIPGDFCVLTNPFIRISFRICIIIITVRIQRPRQRTPPISPTLGVAAACAIFKRHRMADLHHHFLGGYRYCSSIKPRLRIDLGTKKGLPFRACRNSIWFDFYDCSKNA